MSPAPSQPRSVAPLVVGSRGVDSYPYSQGGTPAQANLLKSQGFDFLSLYLGVAGRGQADAALAAGLAVFGVTVADSFDGAAAVQHAQALGLVPGTTLFLDLEGAAIYQTNPSTLVSRVDVGFADPVKAAGYVPGIYVGSPQPLTGDELWNLRVERYWRAPSRVVDRFGRLAEPKCGWCVFQAWPSVTRAGLLVDVDFVSQDYLGRVPTATVAAAATGPRLKDQGSGREDDEGESRKPT